MNNRKTKIMTAAVLIVPLLLSGCFKVRVIKSCKNPERYFAKAYAEIREVHEKDPNRTHRARAVHLLAYNGSEGQLVKVYTPLWVLNAAMDIGIRATEEKEWGFEEEYDFDWREIDDLGKIGPGLLVEVAAEEMKILVWLK